MLHYDYCPQYVINKEYSREILEILFNYIFKKKKYKYFVITIPVSSALMKVFYSTVKKSTYKSIFVKSSDYKILNLKGSWDSYIKTKKTSFRRNIRNSIKKMTKEGNWSIEKINSDFKKAKNIVNIIENNSWKKHYKSEKKPLIDNDLDVFRYICERKNRFYTWNLYSLKLNNKYIAYLLSIDYKDVVYMWKTSYDDKYKKLSPGVFVINTVLEEKFSGEHKIVNWMTSLPVTDKWSKNVFRRVNLFNTTNHVDLILIKIINNRIIKLILNTITSLFDEDKHWIVRQNVRSLINR
jgi:hypothetical protein